MKYCTCKGRNVADALCRNDCQYSIPLPRTVKGYAERQWSAPLKAPAPQQACDVGMFSDDHKQTELF